MGFVERLVLEQCGNWTAGRPRRQPQPLRSRHDD
jgi:hypothetical protein